MGFAVAVALEFINFIVPIHVIEQKYSGGWQQCLRDHADLLGGRVWYDEHLLRDGAMGPWDMEDLVKRWELRGFEARRMVHGSDCRQDFCVADSLGGATLRCDWLGFVRGDGERAAFLKGFAAGKVVGRGDFAGWGRRAAVGRG